MPKSANEGSPDLRTYYYSKIRKLFQNSKIIPKFQNYSEIPKLFRNSKKKFQIRKLIQYYSKIISNLMKILCQINVLIALI